MTQPITIRQLNFAYPGQEPLFTNCQLDIDSSWKLGLLGRNGRGKTTLMKILLNQLPYRGKVISQLPFRYFPLRVTDVDQLAGQSVVDAALDPSLAEWQVERELALMGVDPAICWQPYETLSSGEQTRLQLATLFAQPRVFLLLDEPTNHLDYAGRQQLARYLSKKRQGFIITSHDQDFLDQVVDHCLVIERHQLVLNHGNYSTYFQQKKRRDREALAKNRQLKNEIATLQQRRQKQQQWAQRAEGEKQNNAHGDMGFLGAKAARLMKKAVNTGDRLTEAISQRQGLLQEVETVDRLPLKLVPSHHRQLLTVHDVSLTISNHQLFAPVSFQVGSHDQVALLGVNGSGKSSLLRAIMGTFAGKVTGSINLSDQTTISLIRQDYSTNRGTLRQFANQYHLQLSMLLNILRKLGMERSTFAVPIQEMSMGQQKKVELARSLLTPAQLYLWDEPLNYLDTYNQAQLVQLVKEFKLPLLFVEHDRHFIDAVATKQVVIEK